MARRRRTSLFIPVAVGYAVIALLAALWLKERLDEGMMALLLFGCVPVVMLAWLSDALLRGQMWRQGPRSLTSSSTFNEQRITRRRQPVQFWLMIGLTAVFALAILVFVVLGIWTKVMLAE